MPGGTSLGPVMVDEYNGSLTQNHLETITMKSFRAVQDNAVLETVGDVNTVPTASVGGRVNRCVNVSGGCFALMI